MLTRRNFLKTGGILTGLAAAQALLPGWMPRLAFAQPYDQPTGDVLVAVFLRGGADTLNMIVPYGEDRYYDARPRLAIPRPDDNSVPEKVLDLDGFFGLHPALHDLREAFQNGHALAVHASGAPHRNRSHFVAMDYMERGEMGSHNVASGWIGRHLATLTPEHASPIRGIGWGTTVQAALNGGPSTAAMRSIIDYHLDGNEQAAQAMLASLSQLYTLPDDAELQATAQATQAAIDVVQSVGYADYVPLHGASYADDDFSQALRQTAALIRAQVGLEAACIDLGGWDTHANQGGATGMQARLMEILATGLSSFYRDLGPGIERVTVVVMSEFGRRVQENNSQGTDHGQGGAMLLLSGGLQHSNPVYADWPTLAPDRLDRGDLAITTDYRDVLGELLRKRLHNPAIAEIFPEHAMRDLNLFRT